MNWPVTRKRWTMKGPRLAVWFLIAVLIGGLIRNEQEDRRRREAEDAESVAPEPTRPKFKPSMWGDISYFHPNARTAIAAVGGGLSVCRRIVVKFTDEERRQAIDDERPRSK